MSDNRYRLPPFKTEQVWLAQELTDRLDWGQAGLDEALKHSTGEGVKVAVLDTGIDMRHTHSGDLVGAVSVGRNFTGGEPDDYWDAKLDGHGTHVAGTIGARKDAGPIIGFAPECQLIIGKCLNNGSGSSRGIADAINWSVDQGADVISMSLGASQPSPEIAGAIEKAVTAGVFVIAAAGNSGRSNDVGYPARYSSPHRRPNLDTIAVAAIDKNGDLAPYSSRGPEVDFAAAGSDVLSLWLNGGHSRISGTSMAAPMVSGLVTLMISWHRENNGGITPLTTMAELRDHLIQGSIDAGKPGKDNGFGYGIVTAGRLAEIEEAEEEEIEGGIRLGPLVIHYPANADDLVSFNLKL